MTIEKELENKEELKLNETIKELSNSPNLKLLIEGIISNLKGNQENSIFLEKERSSERKSINEQNIKYYNKKY